MLDDPDSGDRRPAPAASVTRAGEPSRGRGALEDVYPDELAYCRGRLRLASSGARGIPGEELLGPTTCDGLVRAFGSSHEGGDRRALASLWSQWYMGALVTPAVAAGLLTGRRLPLRIGELKIVLDDAPGTVAAFLLPDLGRREPDPFRRLEGLVRGHLAPLVDALAARHGVSRRVLWGNAAHYLEWAVSVLEGEPQPVGGRAAATRELLEEPTWPDGRPNRMRGAIVYVDEAGHRIRRRRTCCLRTRVPSLEDCGSLCPLEDPRDPEG